MLPKGREGPEGVQSASYRYLDSDDYDSDSDWIETPRGQVPKTEFIVRERNVSYIVPKNK